MLSSLAKKLFGSANDRLIASLQREVVAINAMEAQIAALSDAELQAKTEAFRAQLAQGATLDSLLVPAFAVVREAAKRVLGMRPFDVQLIGGMILHKGMISEMKTGEGKTLVATLPTYLNALTGHGVHIVTVNDYLAKRDSEWMGQLHRFLGLSVGVIVHDLDDEQRQAAYRCDITYGTNNEYGFDYLRDNMKYGRDEMVQRPFHFAIVDEVDSILIDEARTPLIISGPTEDNSELYVKVNALIPNLAAEYYELDEKSRNVALNENGVLHMEERLLAAGLLADGTGLYDIQNVHLVHHVNQALRAHMLFKRDTDYIVKEGKVIIIDEFTGRMMEGRRYSEGLHQALEAKEHVKIQNENQTLASVTFQNYFRLYPKLAGMTGTAMTEAGEFSDIYTLDVVEIPTHRAVSRHDEHDEIYRTSAQRDKAVVALIAQCYARKQPVLVGTVSIEKSESFSRLLQDKKLLMQLADQAKARAEFAKEGAIKAKTLTGKVDKALGALTEYDTPAPLLNKEIEALFQEAEHLRILAKTGIPHQVLNARYHEQEAAIISQAGRPGAVTIATNMAGRGTDIMLGGNAEMLLREEVRAWEAKHNAEMPEAERNALAERIRAQVEQDKAIVLAAGGLFVVGTERHESRRIDNQLRGRSGRQGDPGASKFFLSLQDDLMRIFGSERIDAVLGKMGLKEDESIFHPWMNKAIERAQTKVEQRNYEIRKTLLKFDDVMNDQRKVIFEQRIELMDAEDVSDTIESMRMDINQGLIARTIPANSYPDAWDTEMLGHEIFRIYGLHLPVTQWAQEEGIADAEILERLNEATLALIASKGAHLPEHLVAYAQKRVLLETMDQLWKDHLLSLDHLRQGINLRAYAQRDPLSEYKQEAFGLFEYMLDHLREMVMQRLAHLQLRVELNEATMRLRPRTSAMHETRQDPALAAAMAQPEGGRLTHGSAHPMMPGAAPTPHAAHDQARWGAVGRNEPCPCGSGKKFKHCHGML